MLLYLYKEKEIERIDNMKNIPREKWNLAFARAVAIAIDKDYFTDEVAFELFPEEWEAGKDEEIWEEVDKAFKEFFGYDRRKCY